MKRPKITILCPRANATGGTELLHQLGYKLNLLGYDAIMYYYGDADDRPTVHPHFQKYNVPVTGILEDAPGNIFIYPEAVASSLKSVKDQLPTSKHVLWWLSVDNAFMTPSLEKEISADSSLIHFVQSYYADDYVRTVLSVPDDRLFYLSDYINNNYLNKNTFGNREDVVLFNPRKGFERTASLIKSSDHRIRWRALAGLMPEEIPNVLQTAKVYIDFGNHPGKDRFPREAVSCGCRIITGRRGAAANAKDIPIPDVFKLSDDTEDHTILALIYSLIEDYDNTGEIYGSYRRMINEEFHSFETDTLSVFSKITGCPMEGDDLDETGLTNAIVEAVSKEEYKKAFAYLTVYRLKGYRITGDITILESYTRLGLGEEQVALYLVNGLLDADTGNYEAYLIKARALIASGLPEAEEALDLAIKYSTGTEDEGYITEAAQMLREAMT